MGKRVLVLLVIASVAFGGQRVVSLGPSVTRALTALGVEERIVGNTVYCDMVATSESVTLGTMFEINLEKILELNPDHIFAVGLTPVKVVEKLRTLGFEVSLVDDPSSFTALCDNMKAIAQVCQVTGLADSLVADATKRVEQVRATYQSNSPLKIAIQLVSNPPYMVLDGTLGGEMIAIIGGVNPFGALISGSVSRETVLAYNPEVIIFTAMGGGAEAEVAQWQKFTELAAVRRKALLIRSSAEISSPSVPLFAAAVESLAKEIYGGLHE